MWTERVPQNTIDSKVFPRILAMSEVLWNYPTNRNYDAFYDRVQNHYKRLDQLGVEYGLETIPVHFNSEYTDGEFKITLKPGTKDLEIHYQINSSQVFQYDSTFSVSGTNHIKAWATKGQKTYGEAYEIVLYQHKGLEATITGSVSYTHLRAHET